MLIKERKPGNEIGGGGELERAIFICIGSTLIFSFLVYRSTIDSTYTSRVFVPALGCLFTQIEP